MSTKQAAAYINLEVYEDSINLLGVARVQLPAIAYPCVTISGAVEVSLRRTMREEYARWNTEWSSKEHFTAKTRYFRH